MAKTRQHIICAERPQKRRHQPSGVPVSQEDIQNFLTAYENLDRAEGTVQFYQRKLRRFYQDLPEDKIIRPDTMKNWQEKLLQDGYAPGSVNAFLSAANSYLDYIGHREYQLAGQLKDEKPPQPELSRAEYLRMLSAAKMLENERSYLLVKVLGGAGMRVQELPQLTVEAVRQGVVPLEYHNSRQQRLLRLPEALRQELLDYIRREGLVSGPVFATSDGNPLPRSRVYTFVRSAGLAARVPEEKATPRGLWKMYLSTQEEIQSYVALLAEQRYCRMLEEEQQAVGWKV